MTEYKYSSILIVYRQENEEAEILANKIAQQLTKQNLSMYSHPQQKVLGCEPLKDIEAIDLVIVLGGDGTYLEGVRLLEGRKTPILGINLGSLGFLTENRIENTFQVIEQALNSKLEMRPRSMLKVSLKKEMETFEYQALNDIVIERGAQSHLLNLSITSGKHLVSHIKADGLIFSSPTGSTAYNLAAGGPILHPEVKAFCMTPICAHSLTNRPTIFPENQEFHLKLNDKSQIAVLTVDGVKRHEITETDKILICKSSSDHSVLRQPSHNYFDLLREKLKFGERA